MEREVAVFVDLDGSSRFVGRLWTRVRGGRESASFEYDEEWLRNDHRFSIEPALTLGPGAFHTMPSHKLFGSLGDSAPDRWGRALMLRAELRRARNLSETPRTLHEIDYLLLVDDEARQGAVRFADDIGKPFVAEPTGERIPPLVELPALFSAVEKFVEDKENAADLRLLLAPGSSLGGARPKASVRDSDGALAIAKFPHSADQFNGVLWEAVALRLARNAKIRVTDFRIELVTKRPVLILRRFDRKRNVRVPFLSALSMLTANDNEQRSYLEIVDALRQHGAAPKRDSQELWRRIVFTVLISNTDDHLRNHGFLYQSGTGWELSPAYDLNPVPVQLKPRMLSTTIGADDPSASLELAMEMAPYFSVTQIDARKIITEVLASVSTWRAEARALGIRVKEIEFMASAFEHQDLDLAKGIAGIS